MAGCRDNDHDRLLLSNSWLALLIAKLSIASGSSKSSLNLENSSGKGIASSCRISHFNSSFCFLRTPERSSAASPSSNISGRKTPSLSLARASVLLSRNCARPLVTTPTIRGLSKPFHAVATGLWLQSVSRTTKTNQNRNPLLQGHCRLLFHPLQLHLIDVPHQLNAVLHRGTAVLGQGKAKCWQLYGWRSP